MKKNTFRNIIMITIATALVVLIIDGRIGRIKQFKVTYYNSQISDYSLGLYTLGARAFRTDIATGGGEESIVYFIDFYTPEALAKNAGFLNSPDNSFSEYGLTDEQHRAIIMNGAVREMLRNPLSPEWSGGLNAEQQQEYYDQFTQ